jgi:hypothetical protein
MHYSLSGRKARMDPDLYLSKALAVGLYQPIIFISALERHREKPVFSFNEDLEKPPLVYGIYQREEFEIFLPFFLNKHAEFGLDSLKTKFKSQPMYQKLC